MELYNKEELDTLKDFIEQVDKKGVFKDTLESINNCVQLLDDDNIDEENDKLDNNIDDVEK